MKPLIRELHILARLYGVQAAYIDIARQRRNASVEALLATLKALGAPVARLEDVPSAIREKQQSLWQCPLEKAMVAWDGNLPHLNLRLPLKLRSGHLKADISLESGETHAWSYPINDLAAVQTSDVEGTSYSMRHLKIPLKLPPGYHQLTISTGKHAASSLIISAPFKSFADTSLTGHRCWGLFAPLYAVRTADSWGGGDFGDLGTMVHWAHRLGAEFMATLPLLATFFDSSDELNPYFPASRLFWNEFYIDLQRVIQERRHPVIDAIINSPAFREKLEVLQNRTTVDYRIQMDLKRRVMEQLAREFFRQEKTGLNRYKKYISQNPSVEDYARFRAACEKKHARWDSWPNPQRHGILNGEDYAEETKDYYIYTQWLADEQMKALAQYAAGKNMRLYFDLPVGVSPHSYDVWRERKAFISGISSGAPPDSFFTAGQKWGLAPLHPQGLQEENYRYYINCLRHNLKYAGLLRIDHIMGYHRLYVIPDGFDARQGVYIRYQAPEFYAIASLEANRAGAMLLGEDLGTVPAEVRQTMQKHNFYRHYVAQYEISPRENPFSPVPEHVIASLNTHDMPTFAAFWQGADIQQKYAQKLVDKKGMESEYKARRRLKESVARFLISKGLLQQSRSDLSSILKGMLAYLSSSQAQALLINLEDLWLETSPQNVPGTTDENVNYCRMMRYAFEEFSAMPEVLDILSEINRRRREQHPAPGSLS